MFQNAILGAAMSGATRSTHGPLFGHWEQEATARATVQFVL